MAKHNPVTTTSKLTEKDSPDLALHLIAEKRRSNIVALIGIAITFIIGVASLVWNLRNQRETIRASSEVLEISRVENGDVVTNTNDFPHPWVPWIETISPTTIHLGVRRAVVFARPFRKPPHITIALRGLDFPDMATVLTQLGFTLRDARLAERLHHIHLTDDVTDVTTNAFTLMIGIGLPTEAANFLKGRLQDNDAVNQDIVADMRIALMLENRNNLTSDEVWMSNFYVMIGSFQASWIAQVEEDQHKS